MQAAATAAGGAKKEMLLYKHKLTSVLWLCIMEKLVKIKDYMMSVCVYSVKLSERKPQCKHRVVKTQFNPPQQSPFHFVTFWGCDSFFLSLLLSM